MGVVSAIVLVSSFSLGFLLEEEEIHFAPNEESIQNDIDNLVAFGPRVTVRMLSYRQQNTFVTVHRNWTIKCPNSRISSHRHMVCRC